MIVPLSEAAPLCGGKRFFFAERDTHLIGAIRLRARRAFASRKKICAKRCRLSTRAVVRRGSSPSATVRVCVCRPYGIQQQTVRVQTVRQMGKEEPDELLLNCVADLCTCLRGVDSLTEWAFFGNSTTACAPPL